MTGTNTTSVTQGDRVGLASPFLTISDSSLADFNQNENSGPLYGSAFIRFSHYVEDRPDCSPKTDRVSLKSYQYEVDY